MGKGAWVTLATNDSYSLGALVLAHSLKQVGTQKELAILVTPGVTNSMRARLSEVFNSVKEVNILDSKDKANLKLLQRPELGITFTKLHCWQLTEYEKCVFLDADTLVLQNCDELFEREELSAAPDVGWPDCFNSGVFVYRPSEETYNKLIQFALDKGSFDGGDQGLLNLYFSDWAHKDISKHLPFIYNVCSTAFYSYLPAFKQFGKDVKIIHFIGNSKPWLQYFDTESRTVRPSRDLGHLESILQIWWNIFCSMIHPNLTSDMSGLAGAFARLTLGQQRTPEQEALEDCLRRQNWEQGNIDYLGKDSFDNIWSKICDTISKGPQEEEGTSAQVVKEDSPVAPPQETVVAPKEEVPTQPLTDPTPLNLSTDPSIQEKETPKETSPDVPTKEAPQPPLDQAPSEKDIAVTSPEVLPSVEEKSKVPIATQTSTDDKTPEEKASPPTQTETLPQPIAQEEKVPAPTPSETDVPKQDILPVEVSPATKEAPVTKPEAKPVPAEILPSKDASQQTSAPIPLPDIPAPPTSESQSQSAETPKPDTPQSQSIPPADDKTAVSIPEAAKPSETSQLPKEASASAKQTCSLSKAPIVTPSAPLESSVPAQIPSELTPKPVEEPVCPLVKAPSKPEEVVSKPAEATPTEGKTCSVEKSPTPPKIEQTVPSEKASKPVEETPKEEKTCSLEKAPVAEKASTPPKSAETPKDKKSASPPKSSKPEEEKISKPVEEIPKATESISPPKSSTPEEIASEQTPEVKKAATPPKSSTPEEVKPPTPSEETPEVTKSTSPPKSSKLEEKPVVEAPKVSPQSVPAEIPKQPEEAAPVKAPSVTESSPEPAALQAAGSTPAVASDEPQPPITAPPRKSGPKKNQNKSKK